MLDLIIPDLRVRNTTVLEKMDRADADPETLLRTIRRFRLINALFSAARGLLRRHVFSIMEREPARVYSLLDVGAGGCDIARWAAAEARRRKLRLRITALDNDLRVLPAARRMVKDYPEIRLLQGNALDPGGPGPFDFIFSNHFLHHLSRKEIGTFLHLIIPCTRIAFVMNDLKRSRWAYLGATLGVGLLAGRSFAFSDARLSIRRGFLPEELRDFIRINFPGVPIRVIEAAPARVVLVFHREDLETPGHP